MLLEPMTSIKITRVISDSEVGNAVESVTHLLEWGMDSKEILK